MNLKPQARKKHGVFGPRGPEKLLKINSPFYNPGKTVKRGIPNLSFFKEHIAVLI